MSAKDDAIIVLCRVCNRQLCDYPCNKIHLMSEIIAEAQLEAIERYESLYDCTFRADYECGENVQTGKSFIAQKSYLAELRKAAGRGQQ